MLLRFIVRKFLGTVNALEIYRSERVLARPLRERVLAKFST